ncbi:MULTISPECIES: protease modulator HflC [Pseudoxanthomonas]|jgi:membrane protease subunit HflC|uniref:Protein HflC n=1 Tax=Pseudoxanthomonas winnipegensis TaxID=2480810 RepID=A0A4Q8LZM8_9GAMM|nr:protease modulator HflC [Pseudoxanthomonas winnipegensis]RZZ86826.1 protease modulator HflC [Pseudoxanthomonas winnipegensis]TAA07977.1 protease modulator HflC [Pseudoxanthomonas winnipegensis]TAA20969.1 protease modulator HflC [Pseudoxanthomonas winnipegensis]TAA38002.1 protease modulator HflC [Pseudoxanthomonas winnipegensis]TAH72438.1 protease modulator HflC [Pseudoxanthomonas winnipegensis]
MKTSVTVAVIVAALLALMGSVFIVREDQTAMVLNLGRVVRADVKPGLHFKLPLVETARVFDRRFQILETAPERYFTSEQKDVSVDFFAIGYISDVRAYYRATGGDQRNANARLAPIVTNSLRNEINSRTLTQLVSGDRSEIIARQLVSINAAIKNLGMQLVDIRLKQIDLPQDSKVLGEVYDRMRAQRQQVASALRAEGEEQARTIRAEADRQATVIAAEAERDAQRLRGEGDAQAAQLYAKASAADPGFYAFYRSLEAYRHSFADGNAVIVLDKNDPFLQYMKSDR